MIVKEPNYTAAPNFRLGGKCCCNCEHGHLASDSVERGFIGIMTSCTKHGFVPPSGVCDDWEED